MTDNGYATPDLSGALSDIARTLQAEPDVDSTLAAIVKAAVDHVDGAEYAGISLIEKGGGVRTVTPTDRVVATLDEIQQRTRQGPGLDAIADHQVYRTGDLTQEARWPDFSPEAARTGIRSLLSYRLFVTDTTLGALNLYARARNAFSDRTEADGTLFAPPTPPSPSPARRPKPSCTPRWKAAMSSAWPKASSWNATTSVRPTRSGCSSSPPSKPT